MDPKDKSSVDLFLDQKKDIDSIRKDVESLIRTDLNLSHKQDLMVQKLDTLAERLNEGVSKTAWNTWNKVQEISASIIDMKNDNEKRDIKIDHHDFWLKWMFRGIFVVVFLYVILEVYSRYPK